MKVLNPKYSKEEIKNIIKRKNAITDRSILSAVLKNVDTLVDEHNYRFWITDPKVNREIIVDVSPVKPSIKTEPAVENIVEETTTENVTEETVIEDVEETVTEEVVEETTTEDATEETAAESIKFVLDDEELTYDNPDDKATTTLKNLGKPTVIYLEGERFKLSGKTAKDLDAKKFTSK